MIIDDDESGLPADHGVEAVGMWQLQVRSGQLYDPQLVFS